MVASIKELEKKGWKISDQGLKFLIDQFESFESQNQDPTIQVIIVLQNSLRGFMPSGYY